MLRDTPKMIWLVSIIVAAMIGFYLRFAWAMHTELKHLRTKRPIGRNRKRAARRSLLRLNPADFRVEKSDLDAPRIKDKF